MSMWVFCKIHSENVVSYYCTKEKVLFCHLCLLNHVDHRNNLIPLKCEDVDTYCKNMINLLTITKSKI